MRNAALSTTLLGLAALTLACQPAPAELTAEDGAAIEALNERFVAFTGGGETDSLATLYAEDARLMPPYEQAVTGRQAIAAWFGQFDISSFELRSEEMGGAGDLAYDRGGYSITLAGPGIPGTMSDEGKYIVLLERQEDGSWAITHDIWNSNRPPPMPAPADTAVTDTAGAR